MVRFFFRRMLESVPLLLTLSALTFGLFKMIPGDYLTEMEMNPGISSELIGQMRETYALDRPFYVQYVRWLGEVLQGNFGYSFAQRRPAVTLIRERFANTLTLAAGALFLSLLVSIPIGVSSALRPGGWPDHFGLVFSLIGLSLPTIVAALLLLYLAFWTGLLPVGGTEGPLHLILPALTLSLPVTAILSRTLRVELLETLRQPFIVAMAAKGLSRRRILYHAVRNALNPVISLTGLITGGFLSGAVVVEKVFDWPGLGALTVSSIVERDLYVAVNCVLVAALAFLAANLLTDVLLAWNDPRVRYR